MAGVKQIKQQHVLDKGIQLEDQDEWLIKALDDHLTGTQRSPRTGVFYPSALGSKCDAHLFLAYNGLIPSTTLPAITRRIFDVGNSLELRMENYFQRMGILLFREKHVSFDNPPISGRCDFILAHGEDGRIILELKSANNRTFGALRLAPKYDHQVQLQIYLNLSGIDHGVVLYENKDNQQLKAFKVARSDEQWNFILDRCFKIMGMTKLPKTCKGPKWCPCRSVPR